MSLKLAVGNVVQVPVKFTYRDGSVDKLFSFQITAVRRTPEEVDAQPELSVKDYLLDNVTDWSGQRFVLMENNEPAPFSRDNFDFMLKQPGIENVVWAAYRRHCASKEKN